jgi:hypothetical protein
MEDVEQSLKPGTLWSVRIEFSNYTRTYIVEILCLRDSHVFYRQRDKDYSTWYYKVDNVSWFWTLSLNNQLQEITWERNDC